MPLNSIKQSLAPWQERRAEFHQLLRSTERDSDDFKSKVASIERAFWERPLARTPIENLEILGVMFVPKAGVLAALPTIVLNQTLGWYDILRFATPSGRDEITANENFFKLAFVLGGDSTVQQMNSLAKSSADDLKQAVRKGIELAAESKNVVEYDQKWPAEYGLEHLIELANGQERQSVQLPERDWPIAWQDATTRITAYYSC